MSRSSRVFLYHGTAINHLLALLLAALLAAPLASGAYVLGVAAQGFIALIAVLGLHVTVGMAGQINIAQSAFVGSAPSPPQSSAVTACRSGWCIPLGRR